MNIEFEKIELSDRKFPIKTYIVDTNERVLDSGIHIHDEAEIIYMLNGTMEFVIEEETVTVEPGDILVVNGLVAHKSRQISKGYARMCLLQFNFDMIYNNKITSNRYLASFLHQFTFKYTIVNVKNSDKYKELGRILVNIANEFRTKNTAYDLAILSGLYRFFSISYRMNLIKTTSEHSQVTSSQSLERVSEVLNHVQTHYGEIINVKDASELINVNYCYFCRLFKKATGRTFVEYLNFFRVAVAKKKLIQENSTITEIMIDTGFSSHSYFNRIFKRYTGFSPSEYRDRFSNNEQDAPGLIASQM